MPFALIIVAAIFIVTGFKGTTTQFLSTLGKDMAGFVVWIVAIGVIGAIGYIPGMKKISDGFLALILLVMFLSNKGFFAQFNQQVRSPASASGIPQGTVTLGMPEIISPNQSLGTSGQVLNLSPLPSLPGVQ